MRCTVKLCCSAIGRSRPGSDLRTRSIRLCNSTPSQGRDEGVRHWPAGTHAPALPAQIFHNPRQQEGPDILMTIKRFLCTLACLLVLAGTACSRDPYVRGTGGDIRWIDVPLGMSVHSHKRTSRFRRIGCRAHLMLPSSIKGFAIGRQGRTPRHCQRRFFIIPDNRKDPTSS